jgi:hypothetical protein
MSGGEAVSGRPVNPLRAMSKRLTAVSRCSHVSQMESIEFTIDYNTIVS